MKTLKNTMLALLCVVFFVSCRDSFKTVSRMDYHGKYPDESATDMELIFSDSGIINYIIVIPLLNKYMGKNAYMDCPKGITITSYTEDGEPQSRLTADYAISYENDMRMEASKNVVITDLIKNESIETEQIIWDKRSRRIFSNVEVCQKKADGTVNYGDGFDADERFTKYSVRNPRGEMLAKDF